MDSSQAARAESLSLSTISFFGPAKNNLDAVVDQFRISVAKSTYVITERLIVHVKHAPKHIHDIFETRRIFLQN
jgi:hypothetical protein